MKPWWLLLVPGLAFAQSVKQPFNFLWDWTGPVDRFEFKLDAGAYVSVGIPPVSGSTYTMQGDPTLAGAHSAVVRACTATSCSADSNQVSFTVNVPTPAPVPPVPDGLRIIAGALPPIIPPGPVESPSGTIVTTVGGGPTIDSLLIPWTLGPKDPAVEGGAQFVILRNNAINGAATAICYSGHVVYVRNEPGAVWYKWTNDATLPRGGSFAVLSAVPAGC